MTCAGSWPEPDPWMIDTLFAFGASARMIRLNSGTYLTLPGLASSMPFNISGTNCFGSLTNFFLGRPSRRLDGCVGPGGRAPLGHHGAVSRACAVRVAAAFAGIGRAPALRDPRLHLLGL